MKHRAITISAIAIATLCAAALSPVCAVDFVKDVQPIFEFNCVRCHSEKSTEVIEKNTSYRMDNKAVAIRGKFIIPGDGAKSKVYTTSIADDADEDLMPPLKQIEKDASRRLTKEETAMLKKWIDEGANWPDGVTLIARKQELGFKENVPLAAAAVHKRIVANSKEITEPEMQPYSSTIAGSDVMFHMVPIKGGKFLMGSPSGEAGRKDDEGPQKEVSVDAFWIGKHEVRWDEYQLFMYRKEEMLSRQAKQLPVELNAVTDAVGRPTQPYVDMSFGMGTDGYPAIAMTQHAANKYCQWLSAKTGHFYRLPTEAEWEYAARAGTKTAYYWGDDSALAKDYEWYEANANNGYHKVGRKKPNPWGLYDMLGNVAEWTLDQYDPKFYATMPSANPWNKAKTPYPHSVRGGSWDDAELGKLRAASRRASEPKWKRQDPQLPKSVWFHTDAQFLGMRIVRPLKTPSAEEMNAYWNSGVEKDDARMTKGE